MLCSLCTPDMNIWWTTLLCGIWRLKSWYQDTGGHWQPMETYDKVTDDDSQVVLATVSKLTKLVYRILRRRKMSYDTFESFYFIAIHLSTVCINVILSPWCTCFSPLKFNPDLKKIYRNISNKWLNQEFYFAVVKLLLFMLRIFTALIFMDNVQTSYKINKNNYFFARIKGFMKFLLCHLVLTTLIFSKFLLSTVLNLDYFDELDLCIYGTKTAVESEISSIFWITSLM